METGKSIRDEKDGLARFIILLADTGGRPVGDRVKLQGMMYLLSLSVPGIEKRCRYVAGDRGPYSEAVDAGIRRLEREGVLAGGGSVAIALTGAGRELALEMSKKEDKKTLGTVSGLQEFFDDLTRDELLAYICSAHPEMTKKSAELERIRLHMEDHVMSMLKGCKISAERASELLNIPLYDVIQKMKGAGILVS